MAAQRPGSTNEEAPGTSNVPEAGEADPAPLMESSGGVTSGDQTGPNTDEPEAHRISPGSQPADDVVAAEGASHPTDSHPAELEELPPPITMAAEGSSQAGEQQVPNEEVSTL